MVLAITSQFRHTAVTHPQATDIASFKYSFCIQQSDGAYSKRFKHAWTAITPSVRIRRGHVEFL
jgi:hypothetical protein